jgi:hypothetical protein
MNDLIRGAIGGLAGTVAMTAAMAAGRLTGAHGGELPPRNVSRRFEEAVGLYDRLSRPEFEASWMAQHLAYGMGAGVAYSLVDSRLDMPPPAISGPLFGLSLWAVSYAGWLPVAGLYPPPHRDRADRIAAMIAHHLIYGTTTAFVTKALRPGPRATGADFGG